MPLRGRIASHMLICFAWIMLVLMNVSCRHVQRSMLQCLTPIILPNMNPWVKKMCLGLQGHLCFLYLILKLDQLQLWNKLIVVVYCMQQSISITADHDPVIGLPLTPTKRKPYDECDEARSSQISHAQLSSNKLGKHEQLG